MKCKYCGANVSRNAILCGECGNNLREINYDTENYSLQEDLTGYEKNVYEKLDARGESEKNNEENDVSTNSFENKSSYDDSQNESEGNLSCPNASTNRAKTSSGWMLLGLFFPIIGFIMFLVWRESREEDAKNCLIGAIIGIAISFLLGVFEDLNVLGYVSLPQIFRML